MTANDQFYSLYTAIKPITDHIEANEKRIYSIITDIEEDESVSDEQWAVIEEIRSALLELSVSGGHTAMNALKNMAVVGE